MNVASPLCSPYSSGFYDQWPTRARTFFPGQKKCTHGWYSLECPFVHVMPHHQSAPWVDSKTRDAPTLWLIPHCLVSLFKMVNSLEALVLYTVPIVVLFDLL